MRPWPTARDRAVLRPGRRAERLEAVIAGAVPASDRSERLASLHARLAGLGGAIRRVLHLEDDLLFPEAIAAEDRCGDRGRT